MIPLPALLPLLKNKYLIAGVVGAVVIVGAWWWHTSEVQAAWEDGMREGHSSERAVWLVRENKELTEANELITELNNKYRALEKRHVDGIEVLVSAMNKSLKELQDERDKALTDARAGMDFRLRWAASCAPTRKDPGGSSAAEASADPGTAVGTAACELPRQATEDLIRLASEADRVVVERNALLEVAKKDREVCR